VSIGDTSEFSKALPGFRRSQSGTENPLLLVLHVFSAAKNSASSFTSLSYRQRFSSHPRCARDATGGRKSKSEPGFCGYTRSRSFGRAGRSANPPILDLSGSLDWPASQNNIGTIFAALSSREELFVFGKTGIKRPDRIQNSFRRADR